MRDQPTGEQLLETARTLLREELIPALPAERRHAALMIANAMSIAMRQLQNGDEPERREAAALEALLGAAAGDVHERLRELNRRLCDWIRSGRADEGELHARLRQHLLEVARQRVAESNPKYLTGAR